MAKRRILLLVDGSDQSYEMVAYISKVYALWQTEIVLFNVLDPVPDSFWDWEKDPSGPQYLAQLKDWESGKEARVRSFMERARERLVTAGADKDSVIIKVHKRRAGIARDAINEARAGYDAVALGRRGLGATTDLPLGSVAGKILASLTSIPLCIVGGKPTVGRILIGLDSSAGAWRAANFVAKHLGACDPSVTLAHVIRAPDRGHAELIAETYMHKIVESAQSTITPVFEKVIGALSAAGIKSSQISAKTISGADSRAAALIEESVHGMFGTVVIGRRGVSEVVQFQMGRVAAKLTQILTHVALWIVA